MRTFRPRATWLLLAASLGASAQPRTEITKWQDGKQACISLTFDDASINQFRIHIPLLDERNMPGTFFVVTRNIVGSKYRPTFVGRPIMEIVRESATIPTLKENWLERTSMLNYLQTIQRVPEIRDFSAQGLNRLIQRENYQELGKTVDGFLAKLRETGKTYAVTEAPAPAGDRRYPIPWDEIRRHAAKGHEFANHTISHPFTPALNEANILWEAEKAREDLREQLGVKHTFSIEAPYGIEHESVKAVLLERFPLTRNWVRDDFMDSFTRSNNNDPAKSTKPYVQWQRGPLARTPFEQMKGWVDTSLGHGIWLVLVFHGVEGIGWEALPTEIVRSYFDYIKQQEPRLWIATFQDGAKYARERMNSKVEVAQKGETIEVSVMHSLDPSTYDLPLTARTMVPADWRLARFKQGDDVRWLPVHREGGETFVQYRIAPNGKTAVLEKGAN